MSNRTSDPLFAMSRSARRCSPSHRWRSAQPTFGNPSPTAGSETSQKANASADQALYQPVEYTNVNKKGPALIVIPGEIKSNNATFLQKFTANNIADFGEIELSERQLPGARALESRPAAQRIRARLQPGRSRRGAQVPAHGQAEDHQVHRQVRHPEDRAGRRGAAGLRRPRARPDGRAARRLRRSRGGAQAGTVAGAGVGSVQTSESSGVWIIGMRYKIINAETTEQVATGLHRGKDGSRREVDVGARRVASRSRAACRSTRWCSGWCRSRSGKSTTSTSDG